MHGKKQIVIILLLFTAAISYLVYIKYFADKSTALQATGTIEATTVELNTKLAGTIKKLSVEAGDVVKQNQMVAELSRSDLLAQRERDSLTVVKAEAHLNDLLSGAREQEKKEAAANLNIAKANYEKAHNDYIRMETLFQQGAVSETELEKARQALELAKYQLEASEARLSLLMAGTRPQVIEAARAEVERSKAILKTTEAMIEDLYIYSPIDGIVLSKNFEEGEFVAMGTSLATVADLNNLWIKVYIPVDSLPHIKLGQKVHFTVSGIDRIFSGEVQEIASKGEYTPKTILTKEERTNVVFGVKIRIDERDGVLKPGMPADVVFDN